MGVEVRPLRHRHLSLISLKAVCPARCVSAFSRADMYSLFTGTLTLFLRVQQVNCFCRIWWEKDIGINICRAFFNGFELRTRKSESAKSFLLSLRVNLGKLAGFCLNAVSISSELPYLPSRCFKKF